jgi:undecaprenyl-diphosphatase
MRRRRAAVLGLLHGPAELLPVSSSAHAALLLQDLDPERRKELEVALHAGTLLALGLPRPSRWLAVATAPAAIAGALLERPIERHLGTPRTVAAGLLLGGIAMAGADACNRSSQPPGLADRANGGGRLPGLQDALVLGLAQAAALFPGVSRHGAALTALRARGFAREDAHRISREASKPVLLGATVLKGARAVRHGELAPLAAAAAGSAVSTWATRRTLAGRGERMPLWPLAIYRAGLAASVSRMTRDADRDKRSGIEARMRADA